MTPLFRRSWPALLALGLALGLSAAPARAAETVPLSFEETVQQAGSVFVGTPVRQHSYRAKGGTALLTDYLVRVEAPIAGTGLRAGSNVVLTYFGGTVGNLRIGVAGADALVTGQRYVLALRPDYRSNPGLSPVVGLDQGQFPVLRDAATGWEWVADHHGEPLRVRGSGVVRSEEGGLPDSGVGLGQLVRWLQGNLPRIRRSPVEYPTTPLPAAGTRAVNGAAKAAGGAAGAAGAVGGNPTREGRIASFGFASLPVPIYGLPTDRPFPGQDAQDIAKWNAYGQFFSPQTAGTSSQYRFGNERFEIVGLVNDDEVKAYTQALAPGLFPGGWPAGVLGYTIYAQDVNTKRIVEADVLLNNNGKDFTWTLDDDKVYLGSAGNAESFHATLVHELGHVLGLDHDFTDLSIMAYPSRSFRGTSLPFATDVVGLREAYVNFSQVTKPLSDLGIYLFTNDFQQNNTWASSSHPTSVARGGTLTVSNVRIENLGTQDEDLTTASRQIVWYLNRGVPSTSLPTERVPLEVVSHSLPTSLPAASQAAGNLTSYALFDATLKVPDLPGLGGGYFLSAEFAGTDGGPTVTAYPFSNNYAFGRLQINISAGIQTTLTATPASVSGGKTVTFTLGIAAAQSSDVTFNVTSSHPAVVPAGDPVVLKAGKTSVTFQRTAGSVTTETQVGVRVSRASGGGSEDIAAADTTITVRATPTAVIFSGDSSLTGGAPANLKLTLNAPSPESLTFELKDVKDTGLVKLPKTVTIDAGATEVQFSATTKAVPTDKEVTLSAVSTAKVGGATLRGTGTLTLRAGSVVVAIESVLVPSFSAGETGVGAVVLSLVRTSRSAIPLTVRLTEGSGIAVNGTALAVNGATATVTVPAKETEVTFNVTATTAGAYTLQVETAAGATISKSASGTVSAPPGGGGVDFTLDVSSLSFSTSGTKSVTVTNHGTTEITLSVQVVRASGPGTFTVTSGPLTLSGGASRPIQVGYRASSQRSSRANLEISADGMTKTVLLSGKKKKKKKR